MKSTLPISIQTSYSNVFRSCPSSSSSLSTFTTMPQALLSTDSCWIHRSRHIIFPDLRKFLFAGTNAYLEVLLSHMTAPILETLDVHLFPQVRFSTPNLLQFTSTTKNFRLTTVEFRFRDTAVALEVNPERAKLSTFSVRVACRHFDEQVSSMVQILDGFDRVFCAVERLTLVYEIRRVIGPTVKSILPSGADF